MKTVAKTAQWIAIPVLVASFAGFFVGFQTVSEVAYPGRTDENLKTASQFAHAVAGSAEAMLEAVRNKLLTMHKIPGTPADGILHYAVFQFDEQGTPILRSSTGVEERFLPELRAALNPDVLKEKGVLSVFVRSDPQQTREWLALAFPVPGSKGEVVAGLVDPSEVWASVSRFSSDGTGRAYLVQARGIVLAHSTPEMIGADFSELSFFKEGIADSISGMRTRGSMHAVAIDQNEVDLSYVRLGALPIAVVYERVSTEQSFWSAVQESGFFQRIAGLLLAAAGVVFVGIAFAAVKIRRLYRNAESPAAEVEVSLQTPTPLVVQTPVKDRTLENAMRFYQERSKLGTGQQYQDAANYELQRALDEHAMIDRFETLAVNLKNPKQVVERLTETSAVLCKSPTLFFTYFEGSHSVVLQSESGFPEGTQLPRISVPVDEKLIAAISRPDSLGQPISLSDYGPLAQILMNRFGTAYFEAWAVTGFGPLGRAAGRARLLGVLVILKAGTESATRREILSRMMRSTSLVYENAVLSL